jgi:hypothetical protein
MKTNIQFTPNDSESNPWKRPRQPIFEDHILRPEFENRRLRFETGETWLRIVPALPESAYGWLFPIQSLKIRDGQFAHPKTLRPNARCVFDHAYGWLLQHQPQSLYSKRNKGGARLLTSPRCAFWAVVYSETGEHTLKLVVESGYDGSRGGTNGLGFEIWRKVYEKDERGERFNNAVDPEEGVLICIERSRPRNAEFPIDTVRIGRQVCPIAPMLEKVNPEELAALCPLEQVVREPSEDEQWAYLGRVIDPKLVSQIRADLRRTA